MRSARSKARFAGSAQAVRDGTRVGHRCHPNRCPEITPSPLTPRQALAQTVPPWSMRAFPKHRYLCHPGSWPGGRTYVHLSRSASRRQSSFPIDLLTVNNYWRGRCMAKRKRPYRFSNMAWFDEVHRLHQNNCDQALRLRVDSRDAQLGRLQTTTRAQALPITQMGALEGSAALLPHGE